MLDVVAFKKLFDQPQDDIWGAIVAYLLLFLQIGISVGAAAVCYKNNPHRGGFIRIVKTILAFLFPIAYFIGLGLWKLFR